MMQSPIAGEESLSESSSPERKSCEFEQLTPDLILNTIEGEGFLCDGRIFPLNSYENRVYQIGIEGAEPLIAKFYRPGRWSAGQIQEEHDFTIELENIELPVVTPIQNEQGHTRRESGTFHFALYPRKGGHAPEVDQLDQLFTLGRMIGRIHRVGALRPFRYRPTLNIQQYGDESVAFLAEHFVPDNLQAAYLPLCRDLLTIVRALMGDDADRPTLRSHGDCHLGNLLMRGEAVHFVDFDDCRMAPAVQDIWMLLAGDRDQQLRQLSEIIEGYEEFYEFPLAQLRWIEPLRTLRMLHYSAWLGRRWEDPTFPRNFPWFNTERYWGEHILELREQLALMQEAPLHLSV